MSPRQPSNLRFSSVNYTRSWPGCRSLIASSRVLSKRRAPVSCPRTEISILRITCLFDRAIKCSSLHQLCSRACCAFQLGNSFLFFFFFCRKWERGDRCSGINRTRLSVLINSLKWMCTKRVRVTTVENRSKKFFNSGLRFGSRARLFDQRH